MSHITMTSQINIGLVGNPTVVLTNGWLHHYHYYYYYNYHRCQPHTTIMMIYRSVAVCDIVQTSLRPWMCLYMCVCYGRIWLMCESTQTNSMGCQHIHMYVCMHTYFDDSWISRCTWNEIKWMLNDDCTYTYPYTQHHTMIIYPYPRHLMLQHLHVCLLACHENLSSSSLLPTTPPSSCQIITTMPSLLTPCHGGGCATPTLYRYLKLLWSPTMPLCRPINCAKIRT